MTTNPMTAVPLLLLALALPARSQGLSIAADVSSRSVPLDKQVILTVSVAGDTANLPDPRLPAIPNFNVHAAGRGQNISLVNGKFSSHVEHRFVLVPRLIGNAVIGPITVSFGGQTVATAPIEVVVERPASGPQPQAQGHPQAGGSPAARPRQLAPPQESQGNPDLFVTADVDKKDPYVNEPLLMTVRFHYAVPLLGNAEWEPPATLGFLKEDLPPTPATLTTREGRTYYITEIKLVLYPIQPGQLTIGPTVIRCQVQQQQRIDPFSSNFFDQFFSQGLAGVVTKELRTKPISIAVRALPSDGKPPAFTGAVGRFRVKAEADRYEAKVGDAVTLLVTVEGEGNLQALGDLPLPAMESFRVFDTVSSLSTAKDEKGVRGSKTFKTVLVPRVSGELDIPALPFNYFDPSQERYSALTTQPLRVRVSPGSASAPPVAFQAPEGGGEITKVTADIRHVKSAVHDPPLHRASMAVSRARLVHGAPLAVFLLSLLFSLYRGMVHRDPAAARSRGALAKGLRRVRESRGLSDPQARAGLLHETLADYVADKLDRPASGLTLRDAQRLLRARFPRVPEGFFEQLRVLWEELEMFRFAPKGARGAETATLADGVQDLLKTLEKEMRR